MSKFNWLFAFCSATHYKQRITGKSDHDRAFDLACKCYEKSNVRSDDESNGSKLGKYIIESLSEDPVALSAFIYSHAIGLKLLPELYEEYRKEGNYEMQKELMIRLVEAENSACNNSSLTYWYTRMKEDLEEKDWKAERDKLLTNAEKRDYVRYMYLCIAEGNKAKVFYEIMNPQREYPGVSQWFYSRKYYKWGLDERFRFSYLVADDYPAEIYSYWWKRLDELVSLQGRENYADAVSLLDYVREFALNHNLKDDFRKSLDAFVAKHKTKRLLTAMLKEKNWIR